MKDSTRTLAPGEAPPRSEPRRYLNGSGYARLRWKVGPRRYVEAYEHRVVAERTLGRPLAENEQVHHRNHVRDDNRPENLAVLDRDDHMRDHYADQRVDDVLACTLYLGGYTSLEVGRFLGCDPATVSRVLKRNGVEARKGNGAHLRAVERAR